MTYTFKVIHDYGVIYITTAASSEKSARELIARSENCPEHSLEIIK